MSRRGSLGFLIFLVIIALLTWMEVPSWHNGEGAVAVMPPAAPASEAAASPAPETQTMAAAPASEAAAPASAAAGPGSAPQSDVAMATPETPKAQAEAPAMPGPAAGPTFDIVRVEPTGEGVMAGQAEPKATVEVLDGNAPIAKTQSDDTGAWALSLDKPLEPGSHDLGLRATSADKGTATLSDERVTVSVPEEGSKDVLVLLNAPNAPSKVLEVPGGAATAPDTSTTAAAGTAPATAAAPDTGTTVASAEAPAAQPQTAIVAEAPVTTEAPVKTEAPVAAEAPVTTEAPVAAEPPVPAEPKVAAASPPTPEVVVGAVEADTSGALYIGGTATTGQTVRVYLNDQPLGESKPTAAGTWLVQGNRDLPAGKYTVRADQVDAGGTVIARSEVPFEREVQVADLKPNTGAGTGTAGATASATVPMETVVIKRGDNLWRIARTAWGNGFRWTTIYQANNDQIRNPHWIYPGQIFIMPKGDASWAD
jgi:nucleoid-associated protein YgaU